MRRSIAGLAALVLVTACHGSSTVESGGTGGASCEFHTAMPSFAVPDKLDLLFVIDNSVSMADAQRLVRDGLSKLVDRLVNPLCVDADGRPGATPASPESPCTAGLSREAAPQRDMHIGVVSTSLGGHGGTACSPADPGWNPTQNDAGHLLGKVRASLTTYNDLGFLAWDPAGRSSPPGETDAQSLSASFSNLVTASGEIGCPFSAPLEAWYRFLVDPAPPAKSVKDAGSGATVTSGTDTELLDERAAFLRPGSRVAIVMISNKNDCSIADTGLAWSLGESQPMPRATSVCATKPDDACCHACNQPDPPGCSHDPVCDGPGYGVTDDSPALRCWDQRRRFGIYTTTEPDPYAKSAEVHFHPEAGMLYPTERYSNALTKPVLCLDHLDLACDPGESGVDNPLLAGRSTNLVSIVGIVGVPWQDIASEATVDDPDKLGYDMFASDPQRWHNFVGDPAAFIPPGNPLMIETPDVRTGMDPYTQDALAPPGAAPNANPINGHERSIPKRDDLQYACIYPLQPPKDCTAGASCDCTPGQASDNPVCQDPSTGESTGGQQFYGKAYPGIRELEVLHEAGGLAASICPKIQDPSNPDYGFNPVLPAIVYPADALAGRCLPGGFEADGSGHVSCSIVEALGDGSAHDCNRAGRVDLAKLADGDALRKDALEQLTRSGACGGSGQSACNTFQLCALQQLDPAFNPQAAAACQNNEPLRIGVDGFCYAGATADGKSVGSASLLRNCPSDMHGTLRLVGADPDAPIPADGATYVIRCTSTTISGCR